MSTLTALARVQAVRAGRAQPIATVRHLHPHDRPLVLVPLALAGEASTPLAVLVGADREAPRLLVVPRPYDRGQRLAFAADLAAVVVSYVDSFADRMEAVPADHGRQVRLRYANAPQLLVPNRAGVGFLRLFGRSIRFLRPGGTPDVDPAVPVLGRWLTFFAERAEHPGSCLLLAATDALARHWASGQSSIEDQNLAALLGWIDPPPGRTGAQAAARAEDPRLVPPAGPATDPDFDNEVLARLLETADAPAIRRALTGQTRPTWHLVWRAVDLLRSLPAGARVTGRWDGDKDAFTAQMEHQRGGGPPQPRRDTAVAAAVRLHRLERAQASFAAQCAFDDPAVMAEYRLSGEAFAGVVSAAEPDRVEGTGRSRKLRPRVTVDTADPVRLPPGARLVAPSRPGQKATVLEVAGGRVRLELSGGMGRGSAPAPGTVPVVGEHICYSSVVDGFQPTVTFPDRADTPWTHGGPPADDRPADEDPGKEWS